MEGKTALVTGSGRGIGRGFAERLARLGYSVGIHGLIEDEPSEYGEGTTVTDTAAQIGEKFGVPTHRVVGDLTDSSQVERVVSEVSARLGPLELLVHNAGGDIAVDGGKPEPNDAVMIHERDLRAVIERNLMSTILVCREVARRMMERRSGRIVTVGSQAAFCADDDHVMYTTAKAGVVAYTRCLATQLRSHGIKTSTAWRPGTRGAGAFWARGKSTRGAWSPRGRSSVWRRSTRSGVSSSSSRGPWVTSSPGRSCR